MPTMPISPVDLPAAKIKGDRVISEVVWQRGEQGADLDLHDADEHLLKARLAVLIGEAIAQLGLTQSAAAKRLHIAQPDVSNLLRGRLRGYSIERMFGFVRILGNDIDITVRRTAREPARLRQGHLRMRVA
jgi:predicted XRE-type DNA-binding protein